jgi:hypothetical protein
LSFFFISTVFFSKAADKGAVLYTGHIARVAEAGKAIGSFFGVQTNEGSFFLEQPAEIVVLLLTSIAPVNSTGVTVVGHLFDPGIEFGAGFGCFGNEEVLIG